MSKAQQDVEAILNSANALVRDVIVETERIVNTPTREWTVSSRQRSMQALSIRAATASATFNRWIEENVWIKNMGKLCGCIDNIRSHAHQCHFAQSRNWGNAHLKRGVKRLIELLGSGCDYETPVTTVPPEPVAVASEPDRSLASPKSLHVDDSDRPYTVADLAVLHNLSRWTVTRLYENEPGVLILESTKARQRKTGRRRRTIRVPRHVYLRVRRRMEIR